MENLSAQAVLAIWDRTLRTDPVGTPLMILAFACRELDDDALLDMSIGERDRRLLELRRRLFGDRLESYTHCPQCDERLEFAIDADDLTGLAVPAARDAGALEFEDGPLRVRAHAPTSRDLLAIQACADPTQAGQLLLQRCIDGLQRDDRSLTVDELSENDVRLIGDQLSQQQGIADLSLDVACTVCGHRWDMPFDIATFFTSELRHYAAQLLDEVHLLAAAYGWGEREILAMQPQRRRAYLERVLA